MYLTEERRKQLFNRPAMTDDQIQQVINNLRCTEKEREYIRTRVANGDGNMKGALYGSFLRMKREGVIK